MVRLPEPERTVLEGGATVLLLEDHTLPLVHLRLLVRAGSVLDPPGQGGLAALTARAVRACGAGYSGPAAVDEALDAMACEVVASSDRDWASLTLDCLAEDFPRGLSHLSEMVHRPFLDVPRFELERSVTVQELRQSLEDPATVAAQLFRRAVYGEHPYGRPARGTPAEVARLTPGDCRAFHRKHWGPSGAVVGVAGHFDRERTLADLRRVFGAAWSAPERPDPVVPPVQELGGGWGAPPYVPPGRPEARVLAVDRPGLSQSTILMGHLGGRHLDEDRLALELANEVLGGGTFTSRLGLRVRSDEGLAYWVASWLEPQVERGVFLAMLQTRRSQTRRALQIAVGEVRRMVLEAPTPEEVARARETRLNAFASAGAPVDRAIERLASLVFHGLPPDQLARERAALASLGVEEVGRAAASRWHPDGLTVVVVGLPDEGLDALGGFGPVERVSDPLEEAGDAETEAGE